MPIPTNIDPVQQSRLWQRGVSLNDAWWQFGSQRQRELYNGVNPPATANPDVSDNLSGPQIFQAVAAQISEALRPTRERSDIARKMQENVAVFLKKGKLIGYGYLFPRQAMDCPVRIPDDLFSIDFIRWDKSEIEGNGLRYLAIKIFRASWLRDVITPSLSSGMGKTKLDQHCRFEQLQEIPNAPKKKSPKRVGRRPSSEISAIIHELNLDPDFGKLSRKSQAELVIKKAGAKFPKRFAHGKGLHISTVSRYLHQELGD